MPHPTPPELTPDEFQSIMRKGATDEEIETVVRDTFFWSYVVRNPLGRVCVTGRGTRADCIKHAFELADEHAAFDLPVDCETPELEQLGMTGPWRLVLWPPRIDPDPRAFIGDYSEEAV